MSIRNLLRTNTYVTGIVIALLSPAITELMLIPVFRILMQLTGNNHFINNQGILLLSVVPNILFIRYFIVKAHDEKTIKGLVVITTALIILFFVFIHNHPFEFPF
jgi:hypothetical protein